MARTLGPFTHWGGGAHVGGSRELCAWTSSACVCFSGKLSLKLTTDSETNNALLCSAKNAYNTQRITNVLWTILCSFTYFLLYCLLRSLWGLFEAILNWLERAHRDQNVSCGTTSVLPGRGGWGSFMGFPLLGPGDYCGFRKSTGWIQAITPPDKRQRAHVVQTHMWERNIGFGAQWGSNRKQRQKYHKL